MATYKEATSSFRLTSVSGTVLTKAVAEIVSSNATSATVRVTGGARMNGTPGLWSTGVRANVIINAQQVATAVRIFGDEQSYNGSSDYITVSYSAVIPKETTAKTLEYCYVEFYEYRDGTNLGYRETVWPGQSDSDYIVVPALASYQVAYNANGGAGAPASQTKYYGQRLQLRSGTPTRSGYTFAGWATSANGQVAYQPSDYYTANAAVTLYAVWNVNAPTVAPTIGTNTRNSDTSNTVTWTYSETVPPVTTFYIERATNGGAFVQVGTVETNTSGAYVDTSTGVNEYYQYRVRCGNAGGYSPYSDTSNATYNTPSAPTNLAGVFNASYHVVLTWTQTGVTENGVLVEVSTDGGSTWATVTTVSGTDVNTYTDTNPPAGTAVYRVSNVVTYGGTTLTSSPSNTVEVLTLAAPNAPTLLSPSSGAVLNMPASVTLTWRHNPTDGTAQTAATLQYSTDGGTNWTTQTISGSAQSYTLTTSSYSVNSAITWRVRTKGTYSAYGQYSASRTFYLRQAPTATISQPAASDGGAITDVPVVVAFSYGDNSGAFSAATITITNASGAVIYSNNAPSWTVSGSTYTATIPTADFLPANNSTYTLTVVATSDSGLSVTSRRVFVTDYEEPNPPAVSYSIDTDACSVTVNVSAGTGTSTVDTASVGLFRVTQDGELAIAAEMNSGDSVTDYLPPLDQDFTYRAVAYTDNGLTAQTLVTVRVDSGGRAMFNWGQGNAQYAGFAMNLTWSTTVDHKRALYEVVGLQDPVVRTTSRRTKTLSASGEVFWSDDDQLEQLQNVPGRVWFREPQGHVVPVVLKVQLQYPKGIPTTSASVSMTQVAKADGE